MFTPDRPELTLSPLCRLTGLRHATAHRLASELVTWGALERVPSGAYVIGLRLWELGVLNPRGLPLRVSAMPVMEDLHAATPQHVQLAVLDGNDALVVDLHAARGACCPDRFAVRGTSLGPGACPSDASGDGQCGERHLITKRLSVPQNCIRYQHKRGGMPLLVSVQRTMVIVVARALHRGRRRLMRMSASDTPRIAVVGGGIGGLAVCAFLRRAGLAATVYEQAPRLTEVGAGLVLAPNAVRLLRRMDVLEHIVRHAVALEWGWEFRRWDDGTVLSAERLEGVCDRLYGERTYVTHRADLLDAVKTAVPQEWVRLGARCTGVALDCDSVRLEFADGSEADADIVIGADGMHSVVRAAITDPSPPRDSGVCAFRALVPAEKAPDIARRRVQTLWLGPGHHLVHYPIRDERTINLVAFAPAGEHTEESWSATASVAEFLAEFAGWDPRLTRLIRAAGTPGRWALLDRAPLTGWSRGRATLLGDAAHPMFPFYAQGAAQAIEDAATLATCLAADLDDPQRALKRYESVRIERTTRIQEISHARVDSNHLPDGPQQRARDADLASADPLVRNGWIYGHDAQAAAEAATATGRHVAP